MRLFFLLVMFVTLACFTGNAFAEDFYLDSSRNTGALRIEIDNDAIWDTDSNFSNGFSLQYHTVRYLNWEETEAPDFVKWVGQNFPTLGDEGSIVRYGQGIGQNIMTPEDIERRYPQEGDLPYAGTLTYALNWQSFNRDTARIFQVNAGVLGKEAFSADTQKFMHNDFDMGEPPKGWRTQRKTEPILNIAYSHAWRLARFGHYNDAWGGQLTAGPSLHLGNLYTAVDAGFAFRFGWNILEGFSAYPAPPGRGIYQSAHLNKPETVSPHGVEFVLAARGSALAYSVLYDGSFITSDDRDVKREDYILSGIVGINYHYFDRLSIRVSLLKGSDLLDEDSLPDPGPDKEKTDADNSYGTVMIDFHF